MSREAKFETPTTWTQHEAQKMGNKPHALPITHIDLSTSRVLTMYDYVVGDLREVTTGRRQSCPFQSDMEF